jgi:hypothetical protein
LKFEVRQRLRWPARRYRLASCSHSKEVRILAGLRSHVRSRLLLGHADIRSTARYAQLDTADLAAALRDMQEDGE